MAWKAILPVAELYGQAYLAGTFGTGIAEFLSYAFTGSVSGALAGQFSRMEAYQLSGQQDQIAYGMMRPEDLLGLLHKCAIIGACVTKRSNN